MSLFGSIAKEVTYRFVVETIRKKFRVEVEALAVEHQDGHKYVRLDLLNKKVDEIIKEFEEERDAAAKGY